MTNSPLRPSSPLRLARPALLASGPVLYFAVVFLVLWAPLPFGSVEPWSIAVLRFSACALVVIWAVHAARVGVFVISRSMIQVPLYCAAAWAWIQSLSFGGSAISADPFLTFQAAVTLLAFAVFVSAALLALDSAARIERAAGVLFWFAFALSVFGMIQSFTGTRNIYWLVESPVVNFFGPYVNKNHFAGLIEVLLPLGLGPLLTGAVPRDRRLMTLFVVTVILVAVALSRSRGGMIAIVAQVAVLIALTVVARRTSAGDGRRAPALAAIFAIILLVGAGVGWLGAGPITESLTTLPAAMSDQSETSRIEIWSATVSLISTHPIVGSGIGAYGTAILRHWPATEYSTLLYAHNDYLQVVADAGIPGAFLAILFVGLLGVALSRSIHITDPGLRGVAFGAGVGCIGLLIHSVVDFNLQIPSNAIAFLFASAMLIRASSIGVPATARP